jgi:hypothetical protein
MSSPVDWSWKLSEAINSLRNQYDHIGRKTGAPFLGIVYPPAAESAVLREWRTLVASLKPEYDVRTIDVLAVTDRVIEQLGGENIVAAMAAPMPGSIPEAELAQLWTSALVEEVKGRGANPPQTGRIVIVLENLAALYPAAGPRDAMQQLWDQNQTFLAGPVIVLIPGTLVERRVYRFLDQRDELMYRGDIL